MRDKSEEWNDEFYLDGAGISRDDLDYVRIPFLGGPLDGNELVFGTQLVPSEISVSCRSSGNLALQTVKYVLASTSYDPHFSCLVS